MLPSHFHFSAELWDKLTQIKSRSRLDRNDIIRIAVCLSLKSGKKIEVSSSSKQRKYSIKKEVLFGEHQRAFELALIHKLGPDVKKADIDSAISFLAADGVTQLRGIYSTPEITEYILSKI